MSLPAPEGGSARRGARVRRAGALFVVYLVVLAAIAFWPSPVDRAADPELRRIISDLRAHGLTFVTYAHVEFGANVLLFAPFGAILAILLGRIRRWQAVPICFLVSCGIELAQTAFLPGRDGDPRDVVSNTLGAIIGTGLVALIDRAVLASRARREA